MLAVLICTANISYAIGADKAYIKQVASKYMIVMIGIVVFSFILFLILSIHNRFFVANQIKDLKLSKDSLRTPSDKDDAIRTFIIKNNLK